MDKHTVYGARSGDTTPYVDCLMWERCAECEVNGLCARCTEYVLVSHADLAALEHEVEELRAACAVKDQALNAVQNSPVVTGKDTNTVWLQVSGVTRKAISDALSCTPDSVRQPIARHSALGGQEA